MKQAVVFYSKDGSTKVAAQVLAQREGADVFELVPRRTYGKGFGGFMRGGFGAAVGLKPVLRDDVAKEVADYDKIYIGTPLWASRPAPPVNTFLAALDAKGKEIVLFSVQADPSAGKPSGGMMGLKEKLEQAGATVSKVAALYGAGVGKTASADDMKKRIDEQI